MNHYFTYINHKKQTNIYITVIQHPNKNTYITNPIGLKFSILPNFEVTTSSLHIDMRIQYKPLTAIIYNKDNSI